MQLGDHVVEIAATGPAPAPMPVASAWEWGALIAVGLDGSPSTRPLASSGTSLRTGPVPRAASSRAVTASPGLRWSDRAIAAVVGVLGVAAVALATLLV